MKEFYKLITGTLILIVISLFPACQHAPVSKTILALKDNLRNRVAILKDDALGIESATVDAVAEALHREGFEIEFLSVDDVCDAAKLSTERFFLYVIPNAKSYPVEGENALLDYLMAKGNLMILGTSPFSNPLWKSNKQWIDKASVREGISKQQPAHIFLDFDKTWIKPNTNRFKTINYEIVKGGANGSDACLKLTGNLTNHATYLATPLVLWNYEIKLDSTVMNNELFCFWAKGDENSCQVVVHLTDEQGTSGSARILLSTHWTYYVLRKTDFISNGNSGKLDLNKLKQVCLQLDRTTNMMFQGPYTIWFDQVGMAPDPFAHFGEVPQRHLPPIETIAPDYKTYPLTNIAALKVVDSQGIVDLSGIKLATPCNLSTCYARPEGKGFEYGYKWRWIPLIRAIDRDGIDRGAAAWLILNQASQQIKPEGFNDAATRHTERTIQDILPHQVPPFEGSTFAVCAISDNTTLQEIAKTSFFGTIAKRISTGLFLSRAGSQYFSYKPDQKVKVGAVVINNSPVTEDILVRISVRPCNSKVFVFQDESAISVDPGQYLKQVFEWLPQKFSADTYIVTSELIYKGKTIDMISHELGTLHIEKPEPDEFISIKGSDFWLHGKRWYPVGVNYWPIYAMGLEPDDYTYHWLAPGFYNPEEAERDLKLLESLGGNFILIRANAQHDGPNLLDFLRRCKNHDIRVVIHLQSHIITDEPHYFQGVMNPTNFQEELVRRFIFETNLADNTTVFGYDLIWEPNIWMFAGNWKGSHGWRETIPYRQRWDGDWVKWINDRYGSIANAESDWGMPAPRLNGKVTSPSENQFQEDGTWRIMMAAYRRFMDDLMSRKWNDAVQKLRDLDPNHLITFRQGNLGYKDFTLTATPKHVDFFSMEGHLYRPGDLGSSQAGFINRYLTYLLKGKPFIWVEYGLSVWDENLMGPSEQALYLQAKTIEVVQKEALENGANGFSPWWWAGGYRVAERSDFGIINPDGTSRPSTEIFKKYAALFKTQQRVYQEPEKWFTIDRDSHAGSHWFIAFNQGTEAYQIARTKGKKLGVRSPGTGTTSADTPLLAVGNTKYNGKNPPKYLDAEFNWFRIKVGDGPWIKVSDGATIQVPRNKPVSATASVGNLQDATWLTPSSCKGKPGAIYLASTSNSQLKFKKAIIKDTERLEDVDFGSAFNLTEGISNETSIELQMTAEERAWFGEKLRFTLQPVDK